jgi:nucleotide-binding universal stress UspA family protein
LIMFTNCIIVGLDDSAASRAAHQWAAAYAHSTGKDLCAVHVLDWPIGLNASAVKSGTRLRVPKQDVAEPYWRGMHRVFDEIASPPGSMLQFAQGDVGDILVRLSTHADLLVIGTREPVRGRPYLAGSVGHYCVSHASCPVVTVPEQLPNPQPDLSDQSTRLRDFAVAAAS